MKAVELAMSRKDGWRKISIMLIDQVNALRRRASLPRRASSLLSLLSKTFQLSLVCVPACQLLTFSLAHVHFQFVSNSAGFSLISWVQQPENGMSIRRIRISFFRAQLMGGQFLKSSESGRLRLRPPVQFFQPISQLIPACLTRIAMFTIWTVDSQQGQQVAF
jgi:hypothetical protein